MQGYLAAMRLRAVLKQVDTLPGAKHKFAVSYGYVERSSRQRAFDVRRHVIRPFGCMKEQGITVWNETTEEALQIIQDLRVGIFLNDQGRRRMMGEKREQSGRNFLFRRPAHDRAGPRVVGGGEADEVAADGLALQQLLGQRRAGDVQAWGDSHAASSPGR